MSGLSGDKFGLTPEYLEKCKRRVPTSSIYRLLSDEQLTQVDDNGYIKVSLLTKEQLEIVEDTLAFDYALSLTRLGFAGNTNALVNSGGNTEGV